MLAIIAIPFSGIGSEISFCKGYTDVWQGVKETLKNTSETIDSEDKEAGIIKTGSVNIDPAKLYEYAVIEGVYKDIEWEKAEYHLEIKVSDDVSKTVVKVSAYIRGYGELKGGVETFKPTAFWSLKSTGKIEEAFLNDLMQTLTASD